MHVDWYSLFVPEESLLELVIRGTIVYLALFVVLRVLVKRHVGSLGITDLLLIVLIADAAQNGMAGQYKSITGGIVLCGTVIFWSHALDWLAYHVPFLEPLVEPPALDVVRRGKMVPENMRRELISKEELLSQLREHGIDDVGNVKNASVESDGQISVIKNDNPRVDEDVPTKPAKKTPGA